MKKVLIVYFSRTGNTEKMANYIAEGVRIGGCEVELKKVSAVKSEEDLQGYDGYMFGCPTYHRDMTQNFKTFLFLAEKTGLAGKAAGAFGAYTHSGDAPKVIADTMEYVLKMNLINLGSFNALEAKLQADDPEIIKACQDYGRALATQLG
ncbi:MAG: flavodoxin domain-containing protein [Deltaproteobacteria bacterium]|nr:flavodoxin domain-containing protein [Candidatus Anaeroferrophillus wilburensis]MBN2887853.1 flavodoxin domain-containing protein [Deltaproteobacteria bacterium]